MILQATVTVPTEVQYWVYHGIHLGQIDTWFPMLTWWDDIIKMPLKMPLDMDEHLKSLRLGWIKTIKNFLKDPPWLGLK